MKKTISSLVVLSAVLALAFTTGCKNPKTPLTPIPNNPQGVIGQADPTGPSNTGSGLRGNNAGNRGYNGGAGDGNSGVYAAGSGAGIGSGIDTDELNRPESVGSNAAGTDLGSREYFEGREADRSALQEYTIHFDFDSSAVRPADAANVKAVADFLIENPNHALLIEGHCDERGTEEYNQALGERRALSAREAVARAGVEAGRIQTLSLGEAKPVATGSDAASYAANRRGVFVLLLPKTGDASSVAGTVEEIVQ